jgi:hypothetical protein
VRRLLPLLAVALALCGDEGRVWPLKNGTPAHVLTREERARGGRVRAAKARERKAGLRFDHRSSARLVEAAERLGEMLRSDNLQTAKWADESQGSAYSRFRRALDGGNPTIALAAAAEIDVVSLPDALELVLLLVDDPGRFRRAALRWHARYCGELPDVGFEEAHAVLACLAGLADRRPKAAAAALASLVHRRELRRASEVLMRWAE